MAITIAGTIILNRLGINKGLHVEAGTEVGRALQSSSAQGDPSGMLLLPPCVEVLHLGLEFESSNVDTFYALRKESSEGIEIHCVCGS